MLRNAGVLCGLGVSVFVIPTVLPSSAHADASLSGTGAVQSGYSSNILGVAESDDPNARPIEGDGFMTLSPGLSAAYEASRSVHNLNYQFGARLFLSHTEANSFSNNILYQSLFNLSTRSTLRFGAGASSGRISAFNDANTVLEDADVRPEGDIEFIAYNANAAYRRQFNQVWTGEVGFAVATFNPQAVSTDTDMEDDRQLGPTNNAEIRLSIDRTLRRHLLGLQLRGAFNRQQTEEVERSLTLGPSVFWTWNITSRISSNISAGLDMVGKYPDFGEKIYVPQGGAALTYSTERGRATAGWARGVTRNLFGGDTTVNNQFFLNAGLPLPTTRPMALAAALSYVAGDVIDLDADERVGETTRISADIGIDIELTPAGRLGFRLESNRQNVVDFAEMGDVSSTIRQTVATVVLNWRFPTREAARVPVRSNDRVESSNAEFSDQNSNTNPPGATRPR